MSRQNGKVALTPRQKQIYEFIKDKILNRGYGPTVREIGTYCDIASPNGVACHLKALEKKGMIDRDEKVSRGIRLKDSVRQRLTLPMAGQIAAGKPLLAEEQSEQVDFRGLFDDEEHFCLKVKGDLGDMQFADGDCVVVRRQDKYRNGDITVALVDGGNAVLARADRGKGANKLEPIGRKTKAIDPKSAEIVGVVVGMLRQF